MAESKASLSASSTSEGGTARPEGPSHTRRIPSHFFQMVTRSCRSAVVDDDAREDDDDARDDDDDDDARRRRVRARPRSRTRATRGRDENEDESDSDDAAGDATTRTRLRCGALARANRGVDADEELRRAPSAVDALAEETKDAGANERSNGRWRLEYTTEKETLLSLGRATGSRRGRIKPSETRDG